MARETRPPVPAESGEYRVRGRRGADQGVRAGHRPGDVAGFRAYRREIRHPGVCGVPTATTVGSPVDGAAPAGTQQGT
ncbi:hypothetical protein [Actinophytocola gossypii]|uniref:Uncharacterized protein n=1 Tax=Actinophytocola gossypii TaxID=2812003 RepID=A0ABT2JE08_9PSEU|nr:hypothetical protein [Actinophytocola gossypii]MCT2585769.1 hypothetical protein [Actinophytocola gossypii]